MGAPVGGHQRYVLITPARDEAKTLPHTIAAVQAQSLLPMAWVIVSDGSTDATDDLVRAAATTAPFIHLVRLDDAGIRDSSCGKLRAVLAGYHALPTRDYAYVGQLDADVTFGSSYFERLVDVLEGDPPLGITGGVVQERRDGSWRTVHTAHDHVAGAVQFYRRACWEDLLEYVDLRAIQEDTMAETLARWHDWRTRSIPSLPVRHHRPAGTAGQALLRARFRAGMRQYAMGWRFGYVTLRAVYCLAERPLLIGSAVRSAGYVWGALCRARPTYPPGYQTFVQEEQGCKLRSTLLDMLARIGIARHGPSAARAGRM